MTVPPHRQPPRRLVSRGHVRSLAMIVMGVVVVAACSSGTEGGSAAPTTTPPIALTKVAAGFYPIAEAAERVGAECVSVDNLTPPGTGPHVVELDPRTVTDLAEVDVVFYLSKGFQPQVEKAVGGLSAEVTSVDLLEGASLLPVQAQLQGTQGEVDGEELEGNFDPHIWVDPVRQSKIAQTIHDTLVALRPDCAPIFAAGLASYQTELADLSADFASGLANCTSRVIVTSHRAFAYLAERYDLEQISIAGLSPEAEPDPRTLEAVAQAARAKNVTVVYFEEQVPPDLSETVAREIGATTDALSPVETITESDLDAGETYASVMRDNLAALVVGLGCG